MKSVLIVALVASVPVFGFAKDEKIPWDKCKKQIEEFCTTANGDMEKHECLEDHLPKESKDAKIAACIDQNKKNEAKLGHKHSGGKDSHGHKH